jgi:hypothetical protein
MLSCAPNEPLIYNIKNPKTLCLTSLRQEKKKSPFSSIGFMCEVAKVIIFFYVLLSKQIHKTLIGMTEKKIYMWD